ncbi:hypothetical protein KP509_13G007200 [Ceratopteris richardii]|uniref:Uncharacterized protein n=1 Tax=Ceratopteris richardii TaxID=49495 RepID=A0A8T2TDA1_CERRI|nr:hypothetical protein KP509_13G007200 [Ceratopteris richardii]
MVGGGRQPPLHLSSSGGSTFVNKYGRCKRHPQQALIGVCSICLKERLLSLARELEQEEEHLPVDEKFGMKLGSFHGHLKERTAAYASNEDWTNSPRELIDTVRFSSSSGARRQGGTHVNGSAQHALYHQLTNPICGNSLRRDMMPSVNRIHNHCWTPTSTNASSLNVDRTYKSFHPSPRHRSATAPTQRCDEDPRRRPQHSGSLSPAVNIRCQRQTNHWKAPQNGVSPISLAGLDNFITFVKETRVDEPKPRKTKKRAKGFWSLIIKRKTPARPNDKRLDRSPTFFEENRVQVTPLSSRHKFTGTESDSSTSMKQARECICRESTSVLSSPQVTNHMHANQKSFADDQALRATQGEKSPSEPHHGVSSPSWLSAIFGKKKRGRSKSISTGFSNSTDMNTSLTSTTFGRFSADGTANCAKASHKDALMREKRFQKKYSSLFEDLKNAKKADEDGSPSARHCKNELTEDGSPSPLHCKNELCHAFEAKKNGLSKLRNILSTERIPVRNVKEFEHVPDCGKDVDQKMNVVAQSSPRLSPRRSQSTSDSCKAEDLTVSQRSDTYLPTNPRSQELYNRCRYLHAR